MNTPTHMLINWTAAKLTKGRDFPTSAVLWGSLAPDIPLYFLGIGGFAWFRFVEGMEIRQAGRHIFGHLFYNDPIWIALHNFLHSPLLVIALLSILYLRWGKTRLMSSWSGWFLGSCLLHTIVDIPVHHDDGPLVFWPLNWSYRFASPISYWDPNHFGREVMIFESVLFTGLAFFLIIRFWQEGRQRRIDSNG